MNDKTVEDPRARLGDFVAPHGLFEKTTAMPFLGHVSCNVERMEAGSWQEIVLDYEVGASGIADGAWFKATFKFYSDWALFQTDDPSAANFLSAEYQAGPLVPGQSPATVQDLKVRFDQKGHERPFQKAIIVDVVDGYLKPGDHIIIRLGDRGAGGPGTRVQTFVEEGFRFRCYVDPLGTSRFAAVPGDISIDVVAGAPASARMIVPRLVRCGEKAPLRVSLEDSWGNTCWNTPARVNLQGVRGDLPVYEASITLAAQGWAVSRLDDLPLDAPGELHLTARVPDHQAVPVAECFVKTDAELDVPRAFYGDLHVHSDDTVGTNDTRYNLGYGRDVAGLDVLGYTANDFNITQARWDAAVELIQDLNKADEFVCFPGTEWCGNSAAGGDHNVVFLKEGKPRFPFDQQGRQMRSFEWNEDMQVDTIEPGTWPIERLYAAYVDDPEGHLLMPHVGGRRCNLDWHHPQLERLIEVGSAWGQFPWLYQDALRRGYKLGASANSDEHRGRCGGGVPGTAVFGVRGGLTGIIAPRLERTAIAQALRARHTFATTGERSWGQVRCGSWMMGDEWDQHGPATLAYRFLGDQGWDRIEAFDHSGLIWQRDLQREAGYSERRIRVSWGGARIRDRYRWAAWQGRIRVTGGIINQFAARGFEHSEESCWRDSPTSVSFSSDTFGDIDAIELDISSLDTATIHVEGTIDGYVKVGNPLAGNPFVHCSDFSFTLTGAELLDRLTPIRQDLGGAELFLQLDRLSDQAMPRECQGDLTIDAENGPHGFRPIYLLATQSDGSRLWTSAMFVRFD